MNVPGKTEHYLMRIAANVLRAQGVKVTDDEMRVVFIDGDSRKIEVNPEGQHRRGDPKPLTEKDISRMQSLMYQQSIGVGPFEV